MSRTRTTFAVMAGMALATGATASAASAKSYKAYEKVIASAGYHADGTPADESAPPVVGDRFVTEDRVYTGTRAHHSKKPVGYDQINCTIVTVPTDPSGAGGSGRCDGIIALPGGMVYINAVTVPFMNSFTIPVKGVDKFKKAKTLTQTATGNDWSSLVIRY